MQHTFPRSCFRLLSTAAGLVLASLVAGCAVPVADGYAYGDGYQPVYPATAYDVQPAPGVFYTAPAFTVMGGQVWVDDSPHRRAQPRRRDGQKWRGNDRGPALQHQQGKRPDQRPGARPSEHRPSQARPPERQRNPGYDRQNREPHRTQPGGPNGRDFAG